MKKFLKNKNVKKALKKEQELEAQARSFWEGLYNRLETALLKVANSNYEKYFSQIFGYRFSFYILLLTFSIIFGMISVFNIRGADYYAELLGMLTIGWTLPAGAVVFILWNAQEKSPEANAESIEFTIGIILTVCFCIFMQWGFYKAGDIIAWRDIQNAQRLCESAATRFENPSKGSLIVDREYLAPVLPNGEMINIGHIRPPQIVPGQYRSYKPADNVDIKRGEKKEVEVVLVDYFTCRFLDPRTKYVTDDMIYSYDYTTRTWRRGY